jgi:hypothetical protein
VHVLRNAEVFDFETKNQFEIIVTSTDQGGLSISENFLINVLDEELESKDPTDIILSDQSIQENQPVGTLVGTITTIDPDEGDTHSYTLGGDQRESFNLDGDRLLTAEVFNLSERETYEIEITADDGMGGSLTKSFIITVTEGSVLSLSEQFSVKVYPNPTSDRITISGPQQSSLRVHLHLSDGKEIMHEEGNGTVEIDVTSIKSGVYFLYIESDNWSKTQKVIIKN